MRTLKPALLSMALAFVVLPALAQTTATAKANLVGQFVVSVTVTDGGSGYVAPPVVTISGGGGSGAMATAAIANGVVTQITVNQAGSGYTNAPSVVVAAPADFATQGLVAYYPFDGNALDLSGNHNDGTVVGAKLTTDRFGHTNSAYRFNGDGNYIAAAHPLPDSVSATASLWISQEDWSGPQMLFIDGDDAPGHDFACLMDGYFAFVAKDNSSDTIHNWLPPIQTWTHVVLVADAEAKAMQIWINGALRVTNTFGSGANVGYHAPLNFGRRGGQLNDFFYNGSMDDVRFYNRALSGPEVAALYSMESGKPVGVSIAIKDLQLTMTVTPGKTYQLQSSADLTQWVSVGAVFVAATATVQQTVDITENGRYWRLLESP